jgi:ParB-like chromosome segregation protein Spo0J
MATKVVNGKRQSSEVTKMSASNGKTDSEIVVALADIEVNTDWNARSASYLTNDKEPDLKDVGEAGLAGLVASLKASGQDTAVDIRLNPKGKGKKYSLITGFRRAEAVRRINAEKPAVVIPGLPQGSIKAKFHEPITELEARKLNGRENTARTNLPTADVCFLIKELLDLDGDQKDAELADTLSLSRSYVQKLHNIAIKVEPKIIQMWRQAPIKLKVGQMLALCDTAKGIQESAYNAFLTEAPPGKAGRPADANWTERAQAAAKRGGKLIGTLARLGLFEDFEPDADSFDNRDILEALGCKIGERAGAKQMQGVAEEALKGYQIGIAEPEVEAVTEKGEARA